MIEILGITSPIFLIILIGYVVTSRGLFAKSEIQTVGKFVINLALPALVFKALSVCKIADILNTSYLFAYALGSFVALGVGYGWGWLVAGRKPLASAFYAMGSSCSNSGFVGFPILLLTVPSIAGVTLSLNMMVENFLIIPLLLVMLEQTRYGTGGWKTLKKLLIKLATMPLIIAMVAGFLASYFALVLPPILSRTIDMISAASGALSLFVIGGALVGLPIGKVGKSIIPIMVGKLIIHPLGVAGGLALLSLFGLLPLEREVRMAAILSAAMPMMSIYSTLALQYGQEEYASVAQLFTTIASFFTLSAFLWLFQHVL